MALIGRVTRLITADMHAVLDQLEEPETVLKQAIREMEEELARQTQHGRWLVKEIESIRGRMDACARSLEELDSRLDLCFEAENDALARGLVRRKLETTRLRESLEARLATLNDEHAEHDALVADNREQLEGMRRKAEILCADNEVAGCPRDAGTAGSSIDEADIEIAFMREKQRRAAS